MKRTKLTQLLDIELNKPYYFVYPQHDFFSFFFKVVEEDGNDYGITGDVMYYFSPKIKRWEKAENYLILIVVNNYSYISDEELNYLEILNKTAKIKSVEVRQNDAIGLNSSGERVYLNKECFPNLIQDIPYDIETITQNLKDFKGVKP